MNNYTNYPALRRRVEDLKATELYSTKEAVAAIRKVKKLDNITEKIIVSSSVAAIPGFILVGLPLSGTLLEYYHCLSNSLMGDIMDEVKVGGLAMAITFTMPTIGLATRYLTTRKIKRHEQIGKNVRYATETGMEDPNLSGKGLTLEDL